MQVAVRVRPGASRPRIGGEHDGALVIHVTQRAIDGKATAAALTSLAKALGVAPRDVTLVTGQRSRTKIVAIPDYAETDFRGLLKG